VRGPNDGRTDNAQRVDEISLTVQCPTLVILRDIGPILAAADLRDSDHHTCVDLFTGLRLGNRRMLLPQTVIAEIGYLMETKIGTLAEIAFLESVAAGDFDLVSL
jgi:hypothetical protein